MDEDVGVGVGPSERADTLAEADPRPGTGGGCRRAASRTPCSAC